MTKDEARKSSKKARAALSQDEREKCDEKIAEIFLSAFSGYSSYLVYNSFRDEASTKKIIEGLISAGKKVYLPRVIGDEMEAALFGECEKGAFGVEEPKGERYDGKIDVVAAPLLCVNERGCRIGYGKGFFDRFLNGRDCVKVGIGYSLQACDFDEDPWDVPLDFFVSEKGVKGFKVKE